MIRVALLAMAAALGPAQSLPPPDEALEVVVASHHDVTITDADDAGSKRWAVWSDGPVGAATVRLALFSVAGGRATTEWRTAWANAFEPTLRSLPDWTADGRPVLAVTFQYGAAAEQLELYSLGADGRPVRLYETLSNQVSWTNSAGGEPLLVLYNRRASAFVPTCYGWNAGARALRATSCPR